MYIITPKILIVMVKLIFPIELIEKKIVTIQNHSKR